MNWGYITLRRNQPPSCHYFLDEFSTHDPRSKISTIGIVHQVQHLFFREPFRNYCYDQVVFKPKKEHNGFKFLDQNHISKVVSEDPGDIDGKIGCLLLSPDTTLPNILKENGKARIEGQIYYLFEREHGYHHIWFADRKKDGYDGLLDASYLDDLVQSFQKLGVLHGEDIPNLKLRLKELTEVPRVRRLANMRFACSEMVQTTKFSPVTVIQHLAKTSLRIPCDSLDLSYLQTFLSVIKGKDLEEFERSYLEEIKFIARFKFYRGSPKDIADLPWREKQKSSLYNLLRKIPTPLPLDVINVILSYVTTSDMEKGRSKAPVRRV